MAPNQINIPFELMDAIYSTPDCGRHTLHLDDAIRIRKIAIVEAFKWIKIDPTNPEKAIGDIRAIINELEASL